MSKQFTTLYDDVSPLFQDVLKFILIQDPVKIATGFTVGMFVTDFFKRLIDTVVKPLIFIVLAKFSETGFVYTVSGQSFNIGSLITELVVFFVFMIVFYYGFVGPIDGLKSKYNIDQKTADCPYCKSIINPTATRCPSCTSQLSS
jgi:large conductance mechanosensitive channel